MRVVIKGICLATGVSMMLAAARADESQFYFDTGSAKIKSSAAVGKVVKKAGKSATWHVAGFSDPRGSDEVNNRLRTERGNAGRQALISAGVAEDQISVDDGGAPSGGNPKDYWKLRRITMRWERNKPMAETPTPVEPKHPEHVATVTPPTHTTEPHSTGTEPKSNGTTTHTTPPPEHEPKTAMQTPETAGQPKLEHIRLIYWKALNHALWIVAKQKGFFAEEGFDVELVDTEENARKVSAAVQSTSALEKGQHRYAMGAVCGFATHEAMAKGEPIIDIGSMIMIPETLVMKKELADKIDKDTRAFKDTKIGDTVYGAGEHDFKYNNVLRVQLEKAGLTDGKDFQIVEYVDTDKEYKELAAGRIDIAKAFPPSDLDFVKSHPDFVRVPFAKFFPYLPCCRQVITRSQLKENRGKYVKLLRASIRAHQFTVEHPKEAAEIIGKWLKLPPSLVRQSIMSAYVTLTPDPMRKGVELYQRTNDKFTKTKTSTAEFIDTSLYRDALFGLARENTNVAANGYFESMMSRFRANN